MSMAQRRTAYMDSLFTPGKVPKLKSKTRRAEEERAHLAAMDPEYARMLHENEQRRSDRDYDRRVRHQEQGYGAGVDYEAWRAGQRDLNPQYNDEEEDDNYVPLNSNCRDQHNANQPWNRFGGPGPDNGGAPPAY